MHIDNLTYEVRTELTKDRHVIQTTTYPHPARTTQPEFKRYFDFMEETIQEQRKNIINGNYDESSALVVKITLEEIRKAKSENCIK